MTIEQGLQGAGIGAGLAMQGINTIMQQRLAQDNMRLNYSLNEKAADNADLRQRQQWEDMYSIKAQLKQMQDNGLSPSLMYGGTPTQGGANAPQGAGTAGSQIPFQPFNMLEAAEVAKTLAETKNIEAETDTIYGETPRGKADIAVLWTQAGANKAAKTYTEANTKWQTIQNDIAEETKTFAIWKIKSEANEAADKAVKAFFEAQEEGLQWQFDQETYNTRLELLANQVAELAARTALEKAQKELTAEEKAAIKHYIVQGYTQIAIQAKSANAYSDYVEAFSDNLPKQLELRKQELGVEKWRIGVGAVTDLIRAAGYVAGAGMLGGDNETTSYETTSGNTKTTHTRSVRKMPKPFIKM